MTEPGDVDLLINLDVAQKLGLTIPKEILDTANKVIENGQLTVR
jgi:putative ABC transport system substrate-binding protein